MTSGGFCALKKKPLYIPTNNMYIPVYTSVFYVLNNNDTLINLYKCSNVYSILCTRLRHVLNINIIMQKYTYFYIYE